MAKLQSGTRIYGNAVIDTTLDVQGTTTSTSTTTGTIKVAGGVGVVGNIHAGGNIVGDYLIGNYLTGTLTTAAQPNITSTGTLSSLSVTGNIKSGNLNTGNISASGNLIANNANFGGFVFAAGNITSDGNISTTGNLYANNANFSGFLFAGGNITSDGNISTTGNLVANNANFGGFVFATGNITSDGNISTTGNLYANNANFNGFLFANGNITSSGNFYGGYSELTSLSVSGNIIGGNVNSLGDISTVGNIFANTATLSSVVFALGDISTAGNITANNANFGGVVFAGGDLSTTGNINADNANFAGVVFAGGDVSTAGNINAVNANFSGFVFAGSNITSGGNISTTGNIFANNANFGGFVFATGNITSSGNFSTSGNIFANNANFGGFVFATGNITSEGNISTTGNLFANNANFNGVVFANGNITTGSNFYGGYSELSSLSVSGNITGGNLSTSGKLNAGDAIITGNLTVNGTTIYADVDTIRVKDPIIEQGGNTTGAALTTDDGKDRGTVLHYFTSTPVDAFMGWDNSNAEFALGSNVSLTNEVVTFNSFGNLRVDHIIGNGALLTSLTGANVTGQVANALVAGTVYTAAQPNITSTGTLTSLTVGSGGLNVQSTTDSTSTTSGAIKTAGGIGVVKSVTIGENLFVGPGASGTAFVNPTIIAKDTGANYIQAALVNSSDSGSSDWVAYADNGTDTGGWADFGFTSSNFSDPTYSITGPSDGYFFVQSLAGSYGGNLVIATGDQGTKNDIIFATGGFHVADEFARIDHGLQTFHIKATTVSTTTSTGALRVDGGVGVASNLRVGSGIYGSSIISATSNITGGNLLTIGLISATGNITGNYIVGNGALLTDITGANVTGQVANALVAGTVYTAAQPNITSVGTLTSLSATGNVDAGNLRTAGLVSVTGNVNAGNLRTAGAVSATGNVTANYFIGDGSLLTNVTVAAGSAITNGTSNIVVDANANIRFSVAGVPNVAIVTSSGFQTGSGTDGNIYGANWITANYYVGTLTTGAQPNITSVGTLTSLSVTGNVTAGNIKTDNLLYANGAAWTMGGGTAANIANGTSNVNIPSTGSNVTVSVGGTSNVIVVTTTGVNIAGTISSSGNIDAGNLRTAGVVSALGNVIGSYILGNGSALSSLTGSNVTGQVGNALVSGTVYTAAQPNITSLGTLTSLSVTGNANVGNLSTAGTITSGDATITGNLTVNGTTIYANVTSLLVKDPIIEQGGNPNGTALSSNDSKDRGQLLHYYTTAPVDAFMGWDNSNAEFAFGSNVSVSGEVTTFNTLGNVRAGYFLGNGSQLTDIVAITAQTVTSSAQPNITSTGTLASLSVSGNTNVGNLSTAGNVTGSYILGNGSQLTSVVAVTAGTVTTNAQPNITSVGTLTSLSVAGTINAGNFTIQGAGSFSGNGIRITYITGANVVGEVAYAAVANSVAGGNVSGQVANALVSGTVYTAAQPNITSVGTLSSLSVTGNANIGNITTTGTIVAGTGIGGNITGVDYIIANFFQGNGSLLTSLTGANVTGQVAYAATANSVSGSNVTGAVAYATTANSVSGSNVTGAVAYATTANSVAGGNVSGEVTYAATANSVAGGNVSGQVSNALISGTVYTNAQPNITSVGTLTSISVSGNANVGNLNTTGNVTANYFIGNGSQLTDITATTAGTVTTAAQPNITSTGTLASLSVTGNVKPGNLTTTGNIFANIGTFTGAVYSDATSVSAPSQLATKAYVDNQVTAGLHLHEPVLAETTGNLNASYTQGGTTFNITDITTANTVTTSTTHGLSVNDQIWLYNTAGNGLTTNTAYFVYSIPATNQLTLSLTFNGTEIDNLTNATGLTYNTRANSGVGAKLTNAGTQAALVIDNVTLAVGNRVMVRLQTNGAHNGVYEVTDIGSVSTNWELTRTTDCNKVDPSNPLGLGTGDYFYTQDGDLNTGDSHVLTTEPNTMIIGYTALTYTQFSGAVTYTGTSPISVTGQTISIPNTTGTTSYVVLQDTPTLITPILGAATGTSLSVTGNVTANYFLGNGSQLTNITAVTAGTVTTAAQPNITSLGTLTSLSVTGLIEGTGGANINGTINANNFVIQGVGNFAGNGSRITYINGANVFGEVDYAAVANSVAGSNVSGTVSSATSATTAGTVTTAAQPNITSLGTLSSISVTGNANVGNLNTTGIISAVGNVTANYFIGDGSQLTNLTIGAGSAITNGTSNVTVDNNGNVRTSVGGTNNVLIVTSTGANVTGYVNATGNVTASYFIGNGSTLTSLTGANVTGQVSYAATANSVSGSNVAGEVTYAATANAVAGGNVSGQVGNALVAGTVYTNAQPNITSVGTLTSLTSSGTIDFTTASNVSLGSNANVHITGGSSTNLLATDGAGALSWQPRATLTGTTDAFTGNAVATTFTLSVTPASKDLTMVNIDGVLQLKADYTLTGNVIGISPAPASGVKIEVTTLAISW